MNCPVTLNSYVLPGQSGSLYFILDENWKRVVSGKALDQ